VTCASRTSRAAKHTTATPRGSSRNRGVGRSLRPRRRPPARVVDALVQVLPPDPTRGSRAVAVDAVAHGANAPERLRVDAHPGRLGARAPGAAPAALASAGAGVPVRRRTWPTVAARIPVRCAIRGAAQAVGAHAQDPLLQLGTNGTDATISTCGFTAREAQRYRP
jgi:hypothetical protein